MTYRFGIPVAIAGIATPVPSDATNHLSRDRSGARRLQERNR